MLVPHIVLLLFVAGEDADFTDVGGKKAVQDGVAERTGAADDHEGFVCIKMTYQLSFFVIFLNSDLIEFLLKPCNIIPLNSMV